MERIVLGYDGSPASVSALSWVAARAGREVASVGLVNVVGRSAKDRASALDQLAHAEEFLRERAPGVGVELHRLEGGTPESLADFAADTDLLVIGINPGHPIRAAMAGAMPLRLSTTARVPVVMVPAAWVDLGEPVTIGISDDDSSSAALAFAAAEADATRSAIRLVHAWLMPTPSFAGTTALALTPDAAMAEHRGTLDAAMSWVTERYPRLELQSELVRDSQSAALLRYGARSSMLVMGTHHRGVLAGSLLGSVVQEVLWRAECPVAVVPRGAAESRHEED
ncbi:universal stress protein [Microbacterium atlanticum]|uniref:universal stress protein n=1 Tax=Microbacterium atlanticum TaxID=2782168 RepID=UPI001888722D|nr:universal stress protein [Microbacterium atlanticum]